jgi:pyruvate-formate lyase
MKTLEILIEKKRKKMIALANEYGLSAQKTVQTSKELDQLIYMYQKIVTTKSYKQVNQITISNDL